MLPGHAAGVAAAQREDGTPAQGAHRLHGLADAFCLHVHADRVNGQRSILVQIRPSSDVVALIRSDDPRTGMDPCGTLGPLVRVQVERRYGPSIRHPDRYLLPALDSWVTRYLTRASSDLSVLLSVVN